MALDEVAELFSVAHFTRRLDADHVSSGLHAEELLAALRERGRDTSTTPSTWPPAASSANPALRSAPGPNLSTDGALECRGRPHRRPGEDALPAPSACSERPGLVALHGGVPSGIGFSARRTKGSGTSTLAQSDSRCGFGDEDAPSHRSHLPASCSSWQLLPRWPATCWCPHKGTLAPGSPEVGVMT